MTQTKSSTARYTAVLALAAALICAIGALAAVALTIQIGRAATPAAAAGMHRIDAIPAVQETPEASGLGTDYGIVTLALGQGTDYTQTQVDEVLATADRVCEGLTSQVPVTVIEQTTAAQSGMDLPTAHDFVALVAAIRCAG